MYHPSPPALSQRCLVYPADSFCVDVGACMGEPLGAADLTVVGDVYTLPRSAQAAELIVRPEGAGRSVAPDTEIGQPGATVRMIARHTLMSDRAAAVEVLVLEVGDLRLILPLGPVSNGQDYTLMSSAPIDENHLLSNVASVSFTRGTHVTMANGLQVRVEDLQVGDMLLTRDHGAQPIRWIGRQMVRAEGQRATVVITKGAMNNANDLVLSPDHRLFIYQRRDVIGAGRAEVLIRARHLVDGDAIVMRDAGTVEYYHLLFDKHEIIYVEGIQAESLLVTPDIVAGFDEDLSGDLARAMGDSRHVPTVGVEPTARDFGALNAAAALRRASSR